MQSLPRLQLSLLSLLLMVNAIVWVASSTPIFKLSDPAPSESSVATLTKPPTNPPVKNDAAHGITTSALQRSLPFPALPIVRGAHWQAARVRDGESLAAVFKREGISPQELAKITELKPYGRILAKVQAGMLLQYQLDAQRQIALLRYPQSALQTLIFAREADRFNVSAEIRTPETRFATSRATVDKTLIASAKEAGLSTQMTIALAKVFQWDIDFALDVHPGDSYAVVYETKYLDGEHIGDGAIIAAEFVNHGRHFQAVRFTSSDGEVGYFTPDGRSLHKAFLRVPLEFNRVSSNFSMRRMHPITGIVKPHLGIDYAAPVGTPVWAAGDGRVAVEASDSSEGRHIAITHGNRYMTRYLHLSAFARGLRPGAHVHQGEVIGYVGQTGLATGPHLHFEFLEGGVHKNPGSVAMIDMPLPARDRTRFAMLSSSMLAALDAQPTDRVALNLPQRQ